MNANITSRPSNFLSFHRVGSQIHDSFGRDVVRLAANNRFSVSKVATLLGMTIYQLKAALERAIGMGPKEYFRHYRAVWARAMMKEGVGLMEISETLGFRYYTHFAAEIRSFYGLSPRDLQKTLLESTGTKKPSRSQADKRPTGAQPTLHRSAPALAV